MNMKFWNAGAGKAEDIVHAVKNAEAVTIPAGSPVIFQMNGTDDGLAVVLPSSSTAAKVSGFAAGVLVKTLEPGRLGDVQVYGFNRKTLIARGTRAASTAAWPTMASLAIGDVLSIDTALNGFVSSAAGGNSAVQAFAVAAEAIASGSGFASSANSGNPASATVYYQAVKTFLRYM